MPFCDNGCVGQHDGTRTLRHAAEAQVRRALIGSKQQSMQTFRYKRFVYCFVSRIMLKSFSSVIAEKNRYRRGSE